VAARRPHLTASQSTGENMPAKNPEPEILTVAEVAAYLRVHPSTIYRLLKAHQLPAFHVGGDWRFNVEEIDRWREAASMAHERTGS
jgi:excisionase family DNA binding protein